jgi:hypothetical protein
MSPVWLVVIGLWCSVVLVSTGCDPRNSRAVPASAAEVYLAEPTSVPAGQVLSIRVFNQVGGSVNIFTGRNEEVAADVIATGFGAALEPALEEADSHFNLTNTGNEIRVEAAGANQQDSAQLHVRVPPGSSLANITIPRGNVGVYGRVDGVTASITQTGSINVFGASGNINLSTGQGAITAELAPGTNNVTVLSHGGGITVVALSALLNASTTNGDIRFLGTLRNDRHSIAISGTGNIDLALPPYQPVRTGQPVPKLAQPYWISAATSGSPIMADYPPTVTFEGKLTALTICGFVHSTGPYDYHIENTPVRHFGRIEVSPAVTGTIYFSGTLGNNYYRFDTNRPNVLIYAPVPQSIHIYTSEQLNQFMAGQAKIDHGCEGALNPLGSTAIVLNLATGSGRIYLRHIFRKED